MNYLQWNNKLAAYFFNTANAGREIHLYLTKNDIISLGKSSFSIECDEEIWLNYISSIKEGLPNSNGNIISKAKYAHEQFDNIQFEYPPYISYLTFLVLPLIESVNNGLRANNYYGRLNRFLEQYQIEGNIGTNDFSRNQINSLWEDLATWANVKNNGDLGFFKIIPFQNDNWIYVGKVFSQCVLPPKSLNRLPELFRSIGLVPDTFYDNKILKDKIIKSETDLIPNSTVDYLKNDDELSNSIIQTIQRQYKKWSGETHEEIEEGGTTRKKRNYTVAPLFLQFKVNRNDEDIEFSYRMYSKNDYPEDLKFGEVDIFYEVNGWSKTLPFDFRNGLELKDDFNKWIAKYPDRDVRLFVCAGTFQLSNDFWVETDFLSKSEQMYLLCKNDKQELINEWGRTFDNGNFRQEIFCGLPENYSLFWFCNPSKGLPDISILTLYTEKRVELVGGLKKDFRTYSNEYLPDVKITNSDGNENVYLQYKNSEDKISLSKKTSLNNCWLLPENTKINTEFYIKIEGVNFSGNELAYKVVSSDNTAIRVNSSRLPKRDSFGRKVAIEVAIDAQEYCLGSNIVNPRISSQRHSCIYSSLFTSINQDTQTNVSTATLINHNGNKLCNFLSLKSELTTEEFFKAFEFFYSKEFPEHQGSPNYNLTKLKRTSLYFYDYIGILDYDYETKKIILNPPQLIFIPTENGRKVLLIGARDTALIETIISIAPKHNLQVEITKQFSSNERLLLPDVITIRAFKQEKDKYGENSIIAFAQELNIIFTMDYFPQIAMQDFSATIEDYENTLQESNVNDYDWARYIFNHETLDYDKYEQPTFDTSFSLVRYKLNEYTYEYKLWKNNNCYKVDMNWGRYIVLKHFEKEVILFDNTSNKVAIPFSTPLPRLLSEAIMLLSGKAPDFKLIENKKYRVYENVVGIFTKNLFKFKLGQTAREVPL